MNPIIITAAVLFLSGLLYYDKKESLYGRLIFKPLLSLLFILSAILNIAGATGFAAGILAGLILSWIGDVCLIFDSRKMFLAGLIAFLLAHLCYAAVFYSHGVITAMTLLGMSGLLLLGTAVFQWLRPHLGQMKGPVIGYMIVITVMVGGALAMAVNSQAGARFILPGAILFFISDTLLARDKFVAPGFTNRALLLPSYYLAQFLFAASIRWM